MSTFRTMTTEHLGENCTEQDLAWFRLACQLRQEETSESDEEVTDWMWGQGDWSERAQQYADPIEDTRTIDRRAVPDRQHMTTTYRYTVRWVQEGLSDTFAETLRWEGTELLTRSQAEHEADAHVYGTSGTLHPSIGYRILSVQVELLTAETVSLADEATRPDHCDDA